MAVANEFGVADEFLVPLRLNEDCRSCGLP